MPRTIFILAALVLLAAVSRGLSDTEDQSASVPDAQLVEEPGEPVASQPETQQVAPQSVATNNSDPWVVVSAWAHANQLTPPQRISRGTNPVFEVRSDSGLFDFQTATKMARFNGVNLMLGFEPTVFGGEPCLHELDVVKNLEPLLLPDSDKMEDRRVIVIDPGHGGGNTGTRSAEGKLEKVYTLDWALRLRPLLETHGWTVVLTRTNDSELTLPDRVAIADAAKADLFISLHFNASGGGNHQAGLETYCLTPAGMPSTLTRDFPDDLEVVYPNNAFDSENLRLALRAHQALLKVNGGEDRGIRRARFMGALRGQNRPAILIEGGFLSNPEDAARIDDPLYRQKLAEAVAEAVE